MMKYLLSLITILLTACIIPLHLEPPIRPESHYSFMNNCPMDVVVTMDVAATINRHHFYSIDIKSGGIGLKRFPVVMSGSPSITVKTTTSEGDTSGRVLTDEELKLVTYKKTYISYTFFCTSLCGEKEENIHLACSRDTGGKVRRFKFRDE